MTASAVDVDLDAKLDPRHVDRRRAAIDEAGYDAVAA